MTPINFGIITLSDNDAKLAICLLLKLWDEVNVIIPGYY